MCARREKITPFSWRTKSNGQSHLSPLSSLNSLPPLRKEKEKEECTLLPALHAMEGAPVEGTPAASAGAATVPAADDAARQKGAKEVSNSPAFAYLEALVREGRLDAEETERYKAMYQRLHDVVIATYASESALLARAKRLNAVLQEKKAALSAQTSRHDGTEDALKRLRQDLTQSSEELAELEDARDLKQHEAEELERRRAEKEQLLEDKRAAMLAAIEPQVRALERQQEEASRELDEHRAACEKEEAAVAALEGQIDAAGQETARLEHAKAEQQQRLSKLSGEPERLRALALGQNKAVQRFKERSERVLVEIQNEERQLERVQADRKEVEGERLDLGYKLEMLRAAIDKRERHAADVRHETEEARERVAALAERRARLEAELADGRAALRRDGEALKARTKECERAKKRHEKMRRKGETLRGVLPPLVEQHAAVQEELADLEQELQGRRRALAAFQREEDLFLAQYLEQEKLDDEAGAMLRDVQRECEAMEEKLQALGREEAGLQKQIGDLEASREATARQASTAIAACRETRSGLKVKDLVLLDLEKQADDTVDRLDKCSSLYEVVKNQRNRFANLTQSTAQALAEVREKIKILTNEVAILRSETLSRDRVLAEEVRVHQQAKNARDAARVEANKLQNRVRALKQEEQQQLLQIDKLNAIVNQAERELVQLRERYAAAVESRNQCGVMLIDRNDELCILYEKESIHSDILARGQAALRRKDDEIRAERLRLEEARRTLEAARRRLPSPADYDKARAELRELERQLHNETELAATLTAQLEGPAAGGAAGDAGAGAAAASSSSSSSSVALAATGERALVVSGAAGAGPASPGARGRRLAGHDPTEEQLVAKLELLEERLNEKKEQLLEKELILDEVTSLGDKLRVQAAESRQPTLELAKRVNDYQARIRAVTRQMMATVSELSMYQATAMKLEQERGDAEDAVARAEECLRDGRPPTDDAEHEWYRRERDRMAREQAVTNKRQEEALVDAAATDPFSQTTAAPRPNMYIPADELGLPKPYGAHAPFKPSSPGAGMRHIRKPVLTEVQI